MSVASPTKETGAPSAVKGGLASHRDFMLYQVVRICSVLAIQMISTAVAWQVYDTTRSASDLGYVGLAQFAPMLLMSLFAGDAADRFDRRAILMLCHFVVVGVAAMLWFFRGSQIHFVYLALIVFGTARSFSAPAGQALAPTLVPTELFSKAVAWASMIFQLGQITGPALAGVAIAKGGLGLVYGVVMALEFTAVVLLMMIKKREVERTSGDSMVTRLFEGLAFVRNNRFILGAITLDLFAVLLGGAVALMPIFAADILHSGPQGFGWLRAAPAVGALLVALVLTQFPVERRAGLWMFGSVAVFGLLTIGFGLSRSMGLSIALLALLGAADMVSVVLRHTFLQVRTPPHMRGRVAAVNSVFVSASNELGEFESGITAHWLGPIKAVVFGGAGTLLVAAVAYRVFPELVKVDRPTGDVPEVETLKAQV